VRLPLRVASEIDLPESTVDDTSAMDTLMPEHDVAPLHD
jgi:hypothetical protein